jgi:hypothetical protein
MGGPGLPFLKVYLFQSYAARPVVTVGGNVGGKG